MENVNLIEILLSILIAVIGWFLKNLNKRVSDMEKDVSDMKLNYIARFDEAKTHRYQMNNSVVEKLNAIDKKLDIHIAKNNFE